jgi:hypothetical protein
MESAVEAAPEAAHRDASFVSMIGLPASRLPPNRLQFVNSCYKTLDDSGKTIYYRTVTAYSSRCLTDGVHPTMSLTLRLPSRLQTNFRSPHKKEVVLPKLNTLVLAGLMAALPGARLAPAQTSSVARLIAQSGNGQVACPCDAATLNSFSQFL